MCVLLDALQVRMYAHAEVSARNQLLEPAHSLCEVSKALEGLWFQESQVVKVNMHSLCASADVEL